jgi:AAA+ superfamily predicted ATPase
LPIANFCFGLIIKRLIVTRTSHQLGVSCTQSDTKVQSTKYKAQDSNTKMVLEHFIRDALLKPNDVIGYHVGRELAELYPDKTILEGQTWYFDLESFVKDERCSIVEEGSVFYECRTDWEGIGKKQTQHIVNGWLNVLWQGKLLEVIVLTYGGSCRHHWIVADDKTTAESFFDAVCEWSCEVRGEILVYQDGCFEKNKELFDSIKSATFDNLTLRESLKTALQTDFDQFFKARELYDQYGIPWKRGALFVGPPGNGKTHTVKAIINSLGKSCIYVRGFKTEYGTEQENMSEVFKRARMTGPCVVVLEDLDAMVTDENRAFFLNELDGFEVNTGVAVIATTNHPEKLDAAILERPSRFDRKYYFELPNEDERLAYFEAWNEKLDKDLQLSDEALPKIVNVTGEFSFAYLKELLVSSMVQWMSDQRINSMDEVVLKQVSALRNQMTATTSVSPPATVRRFSLLKRAK